MKLVTFIAPSEIIPKIGTLTDDGQSIVILEQAAEIKDKHSAPFFRDMISFLSGTCSGKEGRGCGLEMGRFLNSGDVVELSVEKLGVLRNRVV